MNGKFIILLFVCANLVSVWVSMEIEQTPQKNIIGDLFVFDDSIRYNKQPQVTDSLNGSISTMLTPVSSGVTSVVTGGFSFFDAISLTFGVLSLFTPLPMLTFWYSLGLPWMFALLLSIPIFILYIISIAEFVRGSQL